ncbi:MAG: 3-hydroxyacyl-CoA dehydrogenase NAD-binding domain-containing protein [Pseudomonadota bacterium]
MMVNKAVVIGAGVMGAGIAAQLANAGIEVELLDIVPKNIEKDQDRSFVAAEAIDKMVKEKPAPFMHKRNAKRVRPGNTEDHMDRLADADLIIEAIIENPDIKSELFKNIDQYRKKGSVVGSNTSTIPLSVLASGQSKQLKKDLVITHFFNPPRYMPLLEIVTSKENDKKRVAALADFMDRKMGKTVIYCRDTPGFIANRIGTYWLTVSMNEAIKLRLTPEEADGIAGKPMGFPEGVFSLVDRVGLDLMPHISASLLENIPEEDLYRKEKLEVPLLDTMIENKYTGRKGKGGFFRMNKEGGKKQLEMINLYDDDIAYTPITENLEMKSKKRSIKGGLEALIDGEDIEGQYAWNVLKKTLSYAAAMIPEINDDLTAIDDAMKLGYNWSRGPFEMIDKIGVDSFIKRLEEDNAPVPDFLRTAAGKSFYRTEQGKLQRLTVDGDYQDIKRPEGVLLLSDIKRASKPVMENRSAKLWDIDDGVLCLEFTSQQNSINPLIMHMMNKAHDFILEHNSYKALVIHNEGKLFSAGANIGLAEIAAKFKQYWLIRKMVKQGQDTYRKLKFAPFPVVGAPSQMALGGGCEILLHCDHVQAHAESYIGLVEPGVGLIPGWGGCAEMLRRAMDHKKTGGGPMPPVSQTFETIAMTKVGTSAAEAQSLLYLQDSDGVTMNKSRLLADAKAKALELVADYQPPETAQFHLPGPSGRAALQTAVDGMYDSGKISSYAVVIADQLADVLTGGQKGDVTVELSEDDIRQLELDNFMLLTRDRRTLQRISHMLKARKPLDMTPDFIKEDRKTEATAAALRESLEGATTLSGETVKVSESLREKLKPSEEFADTLIAEAEEKKKVPKVSRTPKHAPSAWTKVETTA